MTSPTATRELTAGLFALVLAGACGSSVGFSAPVSQSREGTMSTVGSPGCAFTDSLALGVSFTEAKDVQGLDAHCFPDRLGLLTHRETGSTYELSSQSMSRTFPRSLERAYAVDQATGEVAFVDLARPTSAFVRLNALGEEVSRVAVDLPHVRSISPEGDFSFTELCGARDEIHTLKDSGSSLRTDLVLLANQRAALVVQTCGYVDVLQFSTATGGAVTRTTIVEVTPTFAVPVAAHIDAEDGEVTIVTSTRNDLDKGPKKISFWRSRDGMPARSFALSVAEARPFAFRDCGTFALLVGELEKEDNLGPNDTTSDDAWIAKVDLEAGVVQRARSIDVEKDDFAFSAACDRKTGDIFVGGTTGRHFVDTGSWDGGGKVLLLRLDGELEERDRLVFGNERLAIADNILIGADRILVTGLWDGIPNNHFPAEERWSRAFFAVLPRNEFARMPAEPRPFRAIGDVVLRAR